MYKIVITRKAARTLTRLPAHIGKTIRAKIKILAEAPHALNNNVKALKGTSAYRLRVGDYRVIYELHDCVLTIEIIEVGHRKEVYQ